MLQSLFNKIARKETPTYVLSCDYWETFNNTYFEKHLQTAASEVNEVNEVKEFKSLFYNTKITSL